MTAASEQATINRDTVPPGLLMIADIIVRIPERRDDLLAYELKQREREIALIVEAHHQQSWHPIKTLKSVLLYGVNAFVLAWSAGFIASVGRSYASLKTSQLGIPVPFLGNTPLNIGSLVPTSTPLSIAAQLPLITPQQAFFIGAAVGLAAVVMRVLVVAFRWKRLRALREQQAELKKEMHILQTWITPAV